MAVPCSGDCGFLAANLYAKSVFGEDALVNLSVEKGSDGKLSGYIRIRYACASRLCLACGVGYPQHESPAHVALPLGTEITAGSCSGRSADDSSGFDPA